MGKKKEATLRLVRLRAFGLHPSTYSPAQAVRPALWGAGTADSADPQAVQALFFPIGTRYTTQEGLAGVVNLASDSAAASADLQQST